MTGTPKVVLHVGEPKTGTTYLQQLLWLNKPELMQHGVLVPGSRPVVHWRATQDLRQVAQSGNDPTGPFRGSWDRLARQALRAPRVAVISHELLAAASAEQASRAVRSLAPAEVHVVLTVRDMAGLLPAEWQETIKHRNTLGWDEWLGRVIDTESADPDRQQWWFWRVHDTMAVLRAWSQELPADRVHVVTVPHAGRGRELLWRRFAELLELAPEAVDTSRVVSNASLGLAEVELLRRINVAFPGRLPDWFYMRNVKDVLAHEALAQDRRTPGRLLLPVERDEWAYAYGEALIGELRDSKFDVVGNLEDLLPVQQPAGERGRPDDATDADVADAAVAAVVAMLDELAASQGLQSSYVSDADIASGSHGRLTRALIELSTRSPVLHRLRRGYWHAANTLRRLRSTSPNRRVDA